MTLILAWYFPGYKLEDIKDLVHQLNAMLLKKPKAALATVRNKYSHKYVFSFHLIYQENQHASRSYCIENDILNTLICTGAGLFYCFALWDIFKCILVANCS
jgi:hypothetical protein